MMNEGSLLGGMTGEDMQVMRTRAVFNNSSDIFIVTNDQVTDAVQRVCLSSAVEHMNVAAVKKHLSAITRRRYAGKLGGQFAIYPGEGINFLLLCDIL